MSLRVVRRLVALLVVAFQLAAVAPAALAQGAPSSTLVVGAADGSAYLQASDFYCPLDVARVANSIQRLSGVAEVGMLAEPTPPAILVRFDPQQTSAEAIGRQAKVALEGDSARMTDFVVTVASVDGTQLLATGAASPIPEFRRTELLVRFVGASPERLSRLPFDCESCQTLALATFSTELFGCGRSAAAVMTTLGGMYGVFDAIQERAPEGPGVLVAFNEAIVSTQEIVEAAKSTLERDELLGATLSVRYP